MFMSAPRVVYCKKLWFLFWRDLRERSLIIRPPPKKKNKQTDKGSLFIPGLGVTQKNHMGSIFLPRRKRYLCIFFFLGALASCTTGVFLIGGLALEGTVFLFLISKREAQSPGELSFLEDTCSVGWKGDQTGLLAPVSPSCPRDCSDG